MLNTKTPPEMRDMAQRLLAYEATQGGFSDPAESATLRVYMKLRVSLVAFAGVVSFQSLASRALSLARTEAPGLRMNRVSTDGYLQELDEFEDEIDIDKDRVGEYPAGEAGIILIARLLGLLHMFLGEALTSSLLRNAWPGAIFDNRNSGNGRKA